MDIFDKYVGQVFDKRYKIMRVVGTGGMSVVFEAIDIIMKRTVAVKMLKDEINTDTQAVKRFVNESKAVAMLSHPNIVIIYDVSVKENLKYIVMEYIDGITLKNYIIKKGALSLREILSYTEQILRGLEQAHSKGIIHRDIKPQNIMLLKNGIIKVMDFGIAKLPDADMLTMGDKAIGTVFYISPEQASGKTIDPRSDLYSLGIVMYEMATGMLPFTADSPVSVALMQVNDQATPPREINPTIPVGLEQIILGAMEKNAERRFQNCNQMLHLIAKIKADPNYVFRLKAQMLSTNSNMEAVPARKDRISSEKSHGHRESELPPKRKNKSMLPIIAGVTAAFLIVIGLSVAYVASTFFQESEKTQAREIEIPNFIGESYSEILNAELVKQSYRVKVEYIYDPQYGENIIIEQKPEEGAKRKVIDGKQYCDLLLTVSRGVEMIDLPDLTIKDYREATNILKGMGLKVASPIFEYHDTLLNGYVIRTKPEAMSKVVAGDEITLYVSQGQEVKTTLVPDFINKTEEEAMRMLVENKLDVGDITRRESEKPRGTILEQSITAYSAVPEKTTKIDFVISLGTPETTAPPETTALPDEDTTLPEEIPTSDVPEFDEFDEFDPSVLSPVIP